MKPRLAQIFMGYEDISGPDGDFDRDDVLAAVESAIARNDDGTILSSHYGVVGVAPDSRNPQMIWFEWYPAQQMIAQRFWMNRSSVVEILEQIKSLPVIPFESMFTA